MCSHRSHSSARLSQPLLQEDEDTVSFCEMVFITLWLSWTLCFTTLLIIGCLSLPPVPTLVGPSVSTLLLIGIAPATSSTAARLTTTSQRLNPAGLSRLIGPESMGRSQLESGRLEEGLGSSCGGGSWSVLCTPFS